MTETEKQQLRAIRETSYPDFATIPWFHLLHKGRVKCPACKKKGVGYASHPHALGYKDFDKCKCRYCRKHFKTPEARNS